MLLGNDRETNNNKTKQRPIKSNIGTVFSARTVLRCYKHDSEEWVVPVSRKRRRSGNTVSDETVMYSYWSSVTWPVNDYTVSYRSVPSSERAPYRKNNKPIVTRERIRIASGHGPQRGARYQDEMVDWPSAVRQTQLNSRVSSCSQWVAWS
jgi:hypothetical protein